MLLPCAQILDFELQAAWRGVWGCPLWGEASFLSYGKRRELHVWWPENRLRWVILLFIKYYGAFLFRTSPCGGRILHPGSVEFNVTI